jgi:hypothetical protein
MSDQQIEYPLPPDDRGSLLPIREIAEQFFVKVDTIRRWAADPEMDFPELVKIKGRDYGYKMDLEVWKRRLPKSRAARKQKMPTGTRGRYAPRRKK